MRRKFKRLLRVFSLENMYWWFCHRYVRKHQYNRIETGLPPGYYDIDCRMIHGNMSMLVRFFEFEMKCDLTVDTSMNLDDQEKWQTAINIYKWWKFERPNRNKNDPLQKYCQDHPEFDIVDSIGVTNEEFSRVIREHMEWDKKCDAEDDEMLCQLARVRRLLWT